MKNIFPLIKHQAPSLHVILLVVTMLTCFATSRAQAQAESIVYTFSPFQGRPIFPSSLVEDASGNLYGTTRTGGANGFGTVFELSPTSNGWQRSTLHSFTGGRDGANPYFGVILDSAGNLYGTTGAGGDTSLCGGGGCGVVFQLYRTSLGGWAERVLDVFSGGTDGATPQGLVFAGDDTLYGFAATGGAAQNCNGYTGCGTVFQLTRQTSTSWKFKAIHIFTGGLDGATPFGAVPAVDVNGSVYGVTELGGSSKYCVNWFAGSVGCGVVFKLSPTAKGGWVETALYRFFGFGDGAVPTGGLTFDAAGNLYGNASSGGSLTGSCSSNDGCGVVFKLTPNTSGLWSASRIHTFSSTEGGDPHGTLAFDASGNLYGSTTFGGNTNANGGTVFQLAPGTSGWTLNVLHSFQNNGVDGLIPSGILLDGSGRILGTTFVGGASSGGIVYEITP